jgi:hypothetical protein
MVGIKRPAEARPARSDPRGVGERSLRLRSPGGSLGWSGGKRGCRNEYARMRARTPHTASPRVPAPWRSAQGEAGPKARPQRRSRWTVGQDSHPASGSLIREGTLERSAGGLVDRPSNGVGGSRPRDRNARGGGDPDSSGVESAAEKSLARRSAGARTVDRLRWARRAASGGRVKRGQGTRHNGPVTSGEGTLCGVAGFAPGAPQSRSESAQATV